MARDFLEEIIAERAAHNPEIPQLVDAALERRRQQRKRANHDVASEIIATQGADHTHETPAATTTELPRSAKKRVV